MSYRSVNLYRLKCNLAPAGLGFVIESPHIMKTVRKLYDNHPDIFIHCEQHLADILRLLLLFNSCGIEPDGILARVVGLCLNVFNLGQAVNKIGNGLSEFRPDILYGDAGILNRIVKHRRHDR